LKALEIKNVPVELAYFSIRETCFSPKVVNITCVYKILPFLEVFADFFDDLIAIVRYCMVVLIVSVSVYVPEFAGIVLKVLRVNDVSILHILLVIDNLLNDAVITGKVRETRINTHSGSTEYN